jgi:predicted porin
VVDASISGYSNTARDPSTGATVKTSRRELANSGYNSSRIGFRGTEDLGGGLAASFWLEAPISNDDGQQGIATFARRSTVSLSGGFGEVRLGRDYTPTFWNDTVFDPFGTNGVGTNLVSTANSAFGAFGTPAASTGVFTNVGSSNYARASNSIGYYLPPNLGGFYGQLQYALAEKTKYESGIFTPPAANTQRQGRYIGGRFGYANAGLDVALAYGSSTVGDNYFAGTTTKVNTLNLGASYDFGPVKLFGELSQAKQKTDFDSEFIAGSASTTSTKLNGWLLGVTVPVGAGLIRAAYSGVRYDTDALLDDPKANKLALGYVHNLSKRTALYTTIARISNKNLAGLTVGGPAFAGGVFTPKTSTGYDFGIRHAF